MSIIEIKTDALQNVFGTLMDAIGISSIAIRKRAIAEIRAKIEAEKLKQEYEIQASKNSVSERFVCYSGNEITPEMITSAIEIDNNVYSPEYRGNADICIKWYNQNPDIYLMVYDNINKKIVGYINAMPISETIYRQLKNGDMIDVNIDPEDILTYHCPDCYYLYISSVAVLPEYRSLHVLYILLNAFFDKIIYLSNYEIFFKEVIADAVSLEGKKLCEYIGMKPIRSSSHNSTIYSVSLLPPKLRIMTNIGIKFMNVYKDKYDMFEAILNQLDYEKI